MRQLQRASQGKKVRTATPHQRGCFPAQRAATKPRLAEETVEARSTQSNAAATQGDKSCQGNRIGGICFIPLTPFP
jgi:hypothetical protein